MLQEVASLFPHKEVVLLADRGYSYLRIGRQWVLNAIHKGKKLMKVWISLCFKDPEPAKASQKQYREQQKKKRQSINDTHEYLDFNFLWK